MSAFGTSLTLAVISTQVEESNRHLQNLVDLTERAEARAGSLLNQTDQLNISQGRAAATISGLVQNVIALTGAYGALQTVRAAIETGAAEDRLEKGFTNILQSAAKAQEVLGQLESFSNGSQFGFVGLADATRQLVSLGVSGDDAVKIVKTLGEGLETLGSGETSVQRIVSVFARMEEQGQASFYMIRTLANEGIPAVKILADSLGVSMPRAMQLLREGAISGDDAVKALTGGIAEMNRHALVTTPTFTQLYNQIKNQLVNAFGDLDKYLGNSSGFRGFMEKLSEWIKEATAAVKQLADGSGPLVDKMRALGEIIEIIIAAKMSAWALGLADDLWKLTTQFVNVNLASRGFLAGLILITAIGVGEWAVEQIPGIAKFAAALQAGFQVLIAIGRYMGGPGPGVGANVGSGGEGLGASGMFSIGPAGFGAGVSGSPTTRPTAGAVNPQAELVNQVLEASVTLNKQLEDINKNVAAGLAPGGGPQQGLVEATIARIKSFNEEISRAIFTDRGGFRFLEPPGGGDGSGAVKISTTIPQNTLDQLNKMVAGVDEQSSAIGLSPDQQSRMRQMQQMQAILDKYSLTPGQNGPREQAFLDAFGKAIDRLQGLKSLDVIARGIGDSFSNAFGDFITGAKNAQQAAMDFAKSLEQLLLKKLALEPLSNAISGGIDSMFGGLFGAGGGITTNAATGVSVNSSSGFVVDPSGFNAMGSAWQHGVRMFAGGGVFDRPTLFGMGGGGVGMMGEAGPEAIMPLTRGSDGKLGVKGGGSTVHNHYWTINTPNADSFRRSQRQIEAMAARTFRSGQ